MGICRYDEIIESIFELNLRYIKKGNDVSEDGKFKIKDIIEKLIKEKELKEITVKVGSLPPPKEQKIFLRRGVMIRLNRILYNRYFILLNL